MNERREAARRRVCLGGLVKVAAFLPEVACTLRDVSLTGARIRLPEDAALPQRFDLIVPSRGEVRRARVVWREGGSAGLSFDDGPPGDSPEAARRRTRREGEVARVRTAFLSGEGGGSLH